MPDLAEVMEKLQEIYAPAQETLFHNRTLYDEDGNLIEDNEDALAAADIEEEEIPDFLQGEEFEVIE